MPLKYSKILNVYQYNHRLSTTIIILLNLKLGWIHIMVKPVTGLSILMPILKLNFITELIFIHQSKPMIFLAKFITLRTTSWITMYIYIFLHISLVTSLFTADLTPNFSESNYIYLYYKWYNLYSNSTNSLAVLRIIQTLDKNSCYTIIQPLAKFLPLWCIREIVLQNYPSLIF